jgi:hypothetical protein
MASIRGSIKQEFPTTQDLLLMQWNVRTNSRNLLRSSFKISPMRRIRKGDITTKDTKDRPTKRVTKYGFYRLISRHNDPTTSLTTSNWDHSLLRKQLVLRHTTSNYQEPSRYTQSSMFLYWNHTGRTPCRAEYNLLPLQLLSTLKRSSKSTKSLTANTIGRNCSTSSHGRTILQRTTRGNQQRI